jgi:hypothetical protein
VAKNSARCQPPPTAASGGATSPSVSRSALDGAELFATQARYLAKNSCRLSAATIRAGSRLPKAVQSSRFKLNVHGRGLEL